MMVKLLLAALTIFCFITCSKDTYNTTPSLKFISVNGTVFPQPSVVSFKLEFTDKEGDLKDSVWIQRVSLVSACNTSSTVGNDIPEFGATKNVKGEFDVNFDYPAKLLACSQQNDTCYFRFWMQDEAKHVSDTVQSPTIVLLKQ